MKTGLSGKLTALTTSQISTPLMDKKAVNCTMLGVVSPVINWFQRWWALSEYLFKGVLLKIKFIDD
jgi:hypothetical protein